MTNPTAAPHTERGALSEQPPIRVLWLIKGLGPGGAERLLVSSAQRRDRARFAIRVAFLMPRKVALVPELERLDVPVSCLGQSSSRDPRWLWSLRRSLLTDPVDVVHAHSPVAAIGARLVLRTLPRSQRPGLVTTDHNVWDSHVKLTRWADRATCALDDAHLTVSEAVRDSMPARLRARAEVVVHGVDVDQVRADGSDRAAVRAELGISEDALVVGTVANLRPLKAYPDLLAAAGLVAESVPGVRFVAVGQGPQEAEIRALHARLGLGDTMLLLGYRPDAVRIMAACDVFCLASLHEGLPVAMMEALALGLPVVATDVGGLREMVEPGREAELVRAGHPEELAAALTAVLTDPGRRAEMAARAAERGASLSIVTAVRRTEAVYTEVVRTRR